GTSAPKDAPSPRQTLTALGAGPTTSQGAAHSEPQGRGWSGRQPLTCVLWETRLVRHPATVTPARRRALPLRRGDERHRPLAGGAGRADLGQQPGRSPLSVSVAHPAGRAPGRVELRARPALLDQRGVDGGLLLRRGTGDPARGAGGRARRSAPGRAAGGGGR